MSTQQTEDLESMGRVLLSRAGEILSPRDWGEQYAAWEELAGEALPEPPPVTLPRREELPPLEGPGAAVRERYLRHQQREVIRYATALLAGEYGPAAPDFIRKELNHYGRAVRQAIHLRPADWWEAREGLAPEADWNAPHLCGACGIATHHAAGRCGTCDFRARRKETAA